MLATLRAGATYAPFRTGAGRPNVEIFYRLCALQVLAALAFLAVAAGTSWIVAHYASGFARLEAGVLKATAGVPGALAERFVAWNGPMHIVYSTWC